MAAHTYHSDGLDLHFGPRTTENGQRLPKARYSRIFARSPDKYFQWLDLGVLLSRFRY